MRRKSERVKDKSTDRKSEKSPKKSRRSSRRRKKSSSTSPEESETDEYETSFKSAKDDTEEEHSSSSRSIHGKSKSSHAETNSDTSALATEIEEKELPIVGGRTRRHSKKQSADEVEDKPSVTQHDSEMRAEKGEAESVPDTLEKHKDSDSKSSVWQVKSADCGGGEIKKLKLCIVRPPESAEPAPRKRKKLSRMSHKDSELADEVDDHTSHDSLDEKRKSRKSDRSVTEDPNPESFKPASTPERKVKADVLSGDEHREEKCVIMKEPLVDEEKKQEDKESSVCENTVDDRSECKEKSTDPFDELTKETRVQKNVQEQSNSSLDKNIAVDVPKSQNSTPTVATSRVPLDNIQTETALTKPSENKFEENAAASAQVLSGNITKVPSQTDSVSSTEANVNLCAEVKSSVKKEPEYCNTMQENVQDHNHEKTSTAPDSPKENTEICNSDPTTLKNKVNLPERISKSLNSSMNKRDPPTHKSAENAKSPNSSENDLPISKLSAKVLKSQAFSPGKSKRRHSSDGSSKDDDSEEERLNHRKQHSDKKRVQLNRTSSDSRRRASEKEEHPTISVASKSSKVRLDEPHDQQILSKHANKTKSVSKESKTKSISEDTSRSERRKYKAFSNQGSSVESTSEKPPVREKISLKRSTSYAIYPTSSLSVADVVDMKVDKEGKHDDGELPDQSSITDEKVSAAAEVLPNLTRKRRWRASQTISTTGKKPTLSISSDSLKHLIPEAKPLAMSEVQLTEDEDEEEEGEVVSEKLREPSEKDDVDINQSMDEVLSSKLTEEQQFYTTQVVPDPPESNAGSVRKIASMSTDASHLHRSPSPARHRISNVLFITNLVRPFTINQLKELLARTGIIQKDGFWIDKIKSKCYVQYETDNQAQETRHALHGVRWPVSNPKQLCVDYAKREDMDLAQELSEGNHVPRKTEPLKIDRIDSWLTDQSRDKERDHAMKDEREREKLRVKEKNAMGPIDILEKSRAAKMAMSVREWDVGKMDLEQFDDRGFHREERSRERERERRIRKERSIRSSSPRELPARKIRKKEEDAPAKLLDDLFKKTKVTPCVYWLPLTADQIVVKEEMRRKHMAEHERRMTEMRKAEKDRQRGRMRGRSSQRKLDDKEKEKRKHRSLSGSPKK